MHVGEFPIRIKSTLNSFSFRISEFVRHTSRNLFSSKHVWPLSLMWFLLLYNMNFFWKIRLFSDDFFLASKGSLIFHQARYRSKCDDRPRWTVEDFYLLQPLQNERLSFDDGHGRFGTFGRVGRCLFLCVRVGGRRRRRCRHRSRSCRPADGDEGDTWWKFSADE